MIKESKANEVFDSGLDLVVKDVVIMVMALNLGGMFNIYPVNSLAYYMRRQERYRKLSMEGLLGVYEKINGMRHGVWKVVLVKHGGKDYIRVV
jgi:hypothetical protein